jgi:hypothetical protein
MLVYTPIRCGQLFGYESRIEFTVSLIQATSWPVEAAVKHKMAISQNAAPKSVRDQTHDSVDLR